LAHVRTAVSAAILRTEIHATKQNVSFRTYRRQGQTLTESANQEQRKSKLAELRQQWRCGHFLLSVSLGKPSSENGRIIV
jgi:hypothetical protein